MKHILLVDDDAFVGKATARVLRKRFLVDVVTSGDEALQALGTKTYDGIVSDLDMPEMDGVDLLARVRQAYPKLADRFVFYTGRPRPDVQAPLVLKPAKVQDLLRKVIDITA